MPMELSVRDARTEDAVGACEVMRRSITELCVADHNHDPAVLQRWLGNKTPAMFASWLVQPGNSLLVATLDGAIAAVGAVTDRGEITLNYVSPAARFRGVSKALLAALERRASDRGCLRCELKSTLTARRFYLANGYFEDGPPAGNAGALSGYRMVKLLRPAPLRAQLPPGNRGCCNQ